MLKTDRSDDIGDFIDFLNQVVGPEGIRSASGGKISDIKLFAKRVQLPLPSLYLGYLEVFGRHDPVLKMTDDADSRIASLLKFYGAQGVDLSAEIPPNCVLLAIQGLSGGRSLLYADAEESNKCLSEPCVVINWWNDIGDICARTFRNYLYSRAYVRGRISKKNFFASLFRADDELFQDVKLLKADLGFQTYWFSDDYQMCIERDDATAMHIVRYSNRTSIYLSAPHNKLGIHLKDYLVRKLALKDSSPR